jgi:hypothetical protein
VTEDRPAESIPAGQRLCLNVLVELGGTATTFDLEMYLLDNHDRLPADDIEQLLGGRLAFGPRISGAMRGLTNRGLVISVNSEPWTRWGETAYRVTGSGSAWLRSLSA